MFTEHSEEGGKDGRYARTGGPARGRRTFSSDYKAGVLRIARELKAQLQGGLTTFLKSEGLRRSHLAEWRKQESSGSIGKASRGRPGKSRDTLRKEIRSLKQRLAAAEKRAQEAEAIVKLQMRYVRGAAWKLERKDRGLLAGILARMDLECPVSSVCEALALTRQDFYRTIKPLLPESPDDPTSISSPS